MFFADEGSHYAGRRFDCGWSYRQQSIADVAARMRNLAWLLGTVDPAWGAIRPDAGPRKFGAGDTGPIVEMTTTDLADLIDCRDRFDPPPPPAPVSPAGYSTLFRNDRAGTDPSHLSVFARVGISAPERRDNSVEVTPSIDHPIWRDIELGVQVLDEMAQCWDAEWACAYRRVIEEDRPRARPWLAWTAKPLRPRPMPFRPYPVPFPLDDAGSPAQVRPLRGGALQIWP